jgi:hypothetical protein
VRAVATKHLSEGDDAAGDPMELGDDDEEEAATLNPPGAGTQIAA